MEPWCDQLFGPPLLFPIARVSGEQWSVELASEWSEGGTVFTHEGPHRIEYPAFFDLVEVYAELLEEGAFDRTYGALLLEPERRRQEARLRASWPHPLYGDAREVSRDPVDWPAHWLMSASIDVESRVPLGATHTIAELVRAAESGTVRGRFVGTVVRLVGSDAGALVIVGDGVNELDVWCPAGVSNWGPVMGGRFEFDVTVEGLVGLPLDLDSASAEIQRHALAGSLEPAQAAAERFFGAIERRRPSAIASDVRLVDD